MSVNVQTPKSSADKFDLAMIFEAYGTVIKIECSLPAVFDRAKAEAQKALIGNVKPVGGSAPPVDQTFSIAYDPNRVWWLFRDEEPITTGTSETTFFKFFNSLLRISVAEHSKSKVFLHAGVVERGGKAIVLPANSYSGKTTLVAELIRNGATYYSDEYAIIDEAGLVHPFARPLSIRDDTGTTETEVSADTLGANVGIRPIEAGLVILTKYDREGEWKPERLTAGNGIMSTVPFAIPLKKAPDMTLKLMNKGFKDSVFIRSTRGAAELAAKNILSFFDNHIN